MKHEGTKTPREPIPQRVEEVSRQLVDAAFKVHSTMGPGLLESVYEVCLSYELTLVIAGSALKRRSTDD